MTKSISDWVSRLSTEPLPVMRRTLSRVQDLLNRASASHTSLREAIEFDPGLSLYIFRQLNSHPRQPTEPVSKLGNAISLLGMGQIEQATQKLPVLEDRLTGTARRNLLDCYSRAAHAAIYAQALYPGSPTLESESLKTAALLHEIGEMALCSVAPDIMDMIRQQIQQGKSRQDAALQVLGFTLEELNQRLSSHWHLPELVQEAQRLYNSFQPQPLRVMLACAVARDSDQSWTSQETLEQLELLAEYLEISQEQARKRLRHSAVVAAHKLQDLPIPLPAFRLVQTVESMIHHTHQSPTESTPHSVQPPGAAEPDSSVRPLAEKKIPPQYNPLHAGLTRTMNEMQDQFGLENVMFAMLSTDRQNLSARFVVAKQQKKGLKGFQVSLVKPSLFSALMKKPQALWLNPGNLPKYSQMIPDSVVRNLCNKGFLLMSIFIKNKPVGLFYADNGWGSDTLTTHQYANFKVLCQRFVQELS